MDGNRRMLAENKVLAKKSNHNCDPPQDFSHFGDDTRMTRSHDTLSVLKTVICVYFSSKTKDTVLPCWFVFFYLPDTKNLCIVDTVA